MNPAFILKGLLIGLSIAAPVGPIGVLCIRRSLKDGAWAGFTAGMGAATADAVYGCVAGFGLTAVSGFLVSRQSWLGLIGGAFLIYLGIRTFLARPNPGGEAGTPSSLPAAYASTFLLTLANPATILSFTVVFAAFGLGASVDYWAAGSLVLGVFAGSALWWLFLSTCVGMLRSRLDSTWMAAVNRISGVTLVAFGLYAVSRMFSAGR